MRQITIDPVTRLEGHLKVMVTVDKGVVKDAQIAGTLYRGFETILAGRDPRDAVFLTQRICGVCPADHATAAALALDNACEIEVPTNGRLLRNIILGSNYLQSHITHFYHLSLADYVVLPENAPFAPHYRGDFRLNQVATEKLGNHYFAALAVRRKCHELIANFAGKMPHQAAIVAGGTSQNASQERIRAAKRLLEEITGFINNEYEEDVRTLAGVYDDYFSVGKGCGNLLTYGAFPLNDASTDMLFKSGIFLNGEIGKIDPALITEDVSHSWYTAGSAGSPELVTTIADPDKTGAYSFVKAPRYGNAVCEVGPLARMWLSGIYTNGISAMDRIVARMLEAKIMARSIDQWLMELNPDNVCETEVKIPSEAKGVGMTEAARGALGHWVKINRGKIERYEAVVPTTWNASPRDKNGLMGPIESALIGLPVPDEDNPLSVVRTIHSFDPCLACAVHLITPNKPVGQFIV